MSSQGGPPQFDPSSLGDPVARLTEWGPCKTGGANFCTHVLRDDGSGRRLSFRPTVGAIVFLALFVVAGCIMLVGAVFLAFASHTTVVGVIAFGLGGLFFGSVGSYKLGDETQPIVFDRAQGLYWKGWSVPQAGAGPRVELDSIHALQLISEYLKDTSGRKASERHSYYSYELNLVLKDGERINVVDHGNLSRLRQDSSALARFLGVPLWDRMS